MLKKLWNMYDEFLKAKDIDKYDFPFPMAVFGTLRRGWSNSCLMGSHKNSFKASRYFDFRYLAHCKAFIPHMLPSGLWLEFQEGCSGAAEVYFYNKNNWNHMIRGVDSLEGFYKNSGSHGYNRTLVKMHLLKKDFQSEFYDKKMGLYNTRDLAIMESSWNDYATIPAWIYANTEININCSKLSSNPVLWFQ